MFPTALPAPNRPGHTQILARAQHLLMRLADHALMVARNAVQCLNHLAASTPATQQAAAEAGAQSGAQAIGALKILPYAARAIHWAITLSRVLSGHLHIPTPTLRPAQTPAIQPIRHPKPARIVKPGIDRSALHRMYRVFATRSIGSIVTRICYDLGIDYADDDLWPDELIAITQTPAQYSAMLAASHVWPAAATPRTQHPQPTPAPQANASTHPATTSDSPPTQARSPPSQNTT